MSQPADSDVALYCPYCHQQQAQSGAGLVRTHTRITSHTYAPGQPAPTQVLCDGSGQHPITLRQVLIEVAAETQATERPGQ